MTLSTATQPKQLDELTGPAIRAFNRIAKLWNLSVEEQLALLGQPARSTLFKWKKEPNPQLPKDTLERISYLVGIYKALQILITDEVSADAWIKEANAAPLFNGQSALDYMLQGEVQHLYNVRQYLDAERGGEWD